ncbi:MAG: Segregation and condensation protein B [Brockia lithotrophica]|uniref:Segregation and condensation protein B n=1 Tax=Brockia lithotrophica TaxID=933949 RepID=A0A2T5G615_9BACL|nr:SMC-Scp complex subunit ScpB [Brockia lithotrophica]PTQ51626.1 MAG: Segregation and condensation protein B [Brockia lithotrophica]
MKDRATDGELLALLFVAGDEGLPLGKAADVLEIPPDVVEHRLEEFRALWNAEDRGLFVERVGDVYRLVTRPEHAPLLLRFLEGGRSSAGLSPAALECLTIVAYRQPVSRAEIEEIRGTRSDRPIETLLERGLIREVGRGEGIGRPILYGTTDRFLSLFGLSSLEELPPLPSEEEVERELFR